MKKYPIKFYCFLSLALFISACSPKQKLNKFSDKKVLTANCLESKLGKDTAITISKLPFYVYIEEIKLNNKVYPIKKEKVTEITNESDLLIFGDSFAFKFFVYRSLEYGQIKYHLRWDLLIKNDKCWNIVSETNSHQIDMNKRANEVSRIAGSSYSMEIADGDTKWKIELKWNYGFLHKMPGS